MRLGSLPWVEEKARNIQADMSYEIEIIIFPDTNQHDNDIRSSVLVPHENARVLEEVGCFRAAICQSYCSRRDLCKNSRLAQPHVPREFAFHKG